MRAQLFLIAIFTILFSACSSTKEYYIEPEFQKEKISSSVLIVPVQQKWFEANFSHAFGQLSGTGKTTFYSSLENLMSEKLRSRIKMVGSDQSFNGNLFRSTTLDSKSGEFQVMLPVDDKQFDLPEYKPGIVLILDQYYYYKKKKNFGGTGYAGHETTAQNVLYFETKYIYWDTSAGKPVAWGSSYASKSISDKQVPGQDDYREVLSKVFDKVVKQGPLL